MLSLLIYLCQFEHFSFSSGNSTLFVLLLIFFSRRSEEISFYMFVLLISLDLCVCLCLLFSLDVTVPVNFGLTELRLAAVWRWFTLLFCIAPVA